MIQNIEPLRALLANPIIVPVEIIILETRQVRAFWSGEENIELKLNTPLIENKTSYQCVGVGKIFIRQDTTGDTQLGFKNNNLKIDSPPNEVFNLFNSLETKMANFFLVQGFLNSNTGKLLDQFVIPLSGLIISSQAVTEHNGNRYINLSLNSFGYQLSFGGNQLRSNKDQLKRDSNDFIYKYTETIGDRKISWGQVPGHSLRSRWNVYFNGKHWV